MTYPVNSGLHLVILYSGLPLEIVKYCNCEFSGLDMIVGLQHKYSAERTGIFVNSSSVVLVRSTLIQNSIKRPLIPAL